jgi:hypothetical protein
LCQAGIDATYYQLQAVRPLAQMQCYKLVRIYKRNFNLSEMEAKKFRIGNYLRSKQWFGHGQIQGIEETENGFQLKVKGFVHEWEHGKYFDLEEIVLTEEWLSKFGFIEEEPNEFTLRQSPIIFNVHRNFITGEFMCRLVYHYSFRIKTVNELQNLFFAITRQELELKDER